MAPWVSEHSMQNNNVAPGSIGFYEQIMPIYIGEILLIWYIVISTDIYRHADASVELQFTVLYIRVVESRKWTRAAVSLCGNEGKKKKPNFLLFSQARWSKIAHFLMWSETITTAKVWTDQCSSNVKEAPDPKRIKCNSIVKVRKWDDTYFRYASFLPNS